MAKSPSRFNLSWGRFAQFSGVSWRRSGRFDDRGQAIHGRPVGPASNDLLFDLDRTSDEDTQKSWRKILDRPALLPPRPRLVQVSVAYDNSPNNPGGVLVGSAVTQFSFL